MVSCKMWIYTTLLCFGFLFGASTSCLIDDSIKAAIFNLTTSYHVNKVERMGIWEYDLSMLIQWNISKDAEFDGIMYKFNDATSGDTTSGDTTSGDTTSGNAHFQGVPHPDAAETRPRTPPCQNINSTIWTVDKNGSSVTCQIPCKKYLGRECGFGGICFLISLGYKSLSKNTRNLTVPMKFGQRHFFRMYAYRGWAHGGELKYHFRQTVAFCHHELITQFKIDKDYAEEYCRNNQTIDDGAFTTGPITDFEIVSKQINISSNRGILVMRWRDPHDVHPSTFIIKSNVQATNAKVLNPNELDASSKSDDGYYTVTFGNIKFDEQIILKINPITDVLHCPARCNRHGWTVIKDLEMEDMDACANINGTTPFCVPIAECKDGSASDYMAATCTCPSGYIGNGRSPEYRDGNGCEVFDGCDNNTKVEEVCVQAATCQGSSLSSSSDFNCSCPIGFYGDGYRNGTGCIYNYNTSTGNIIIVSVCVVAFFIILAVALAVYCRKRQRDLRFKLTSRFEATLFNTIKNSNSDSTVGFFGEKWELDRSSIELKGIIGRGNFGVVHRAVLKTEDGEESVAVKMTTDAASEEYKKAFKHEIYLLSEIDTHQNLLGLIGCCTGGNQSWYMVTQFMKYGDLLHFLWKSREAHLRDEDPIYQMNEYNVYQIAGQVASGMQHLKKMRIIHGDLAARNVLIGEGLSCKISDFGLANNVYEEGILRNVIEKTVPLRWVSPERMMDGRVPIDWRSDVWSYGILLYETVTLGATPYAGIESQELFAKLKSGYRMQRPSYCTQSLYDIMLQCWEWRPSKRPTFAGLEKMMKEPAQPSCVTYVNLHTVVADLDPPEETSNTSNSTPRTIANNFAQSFVNESEKLV